MTEVKEEIIDFTDDFPSTSFEESKTEVLDQLESAIGIRPRPVICKPGNVNVSEPLEPKRHWAPGAWQDATRTSAFIPYKPPTLLTNLQRGNTQTEAPVPYSGDVTFYTLAGQGELTDENIKPNQIDIPDENNLSALMWAAFYGQVNSAKLLIKSGANVNFRGSVNESPLHLAAANGHHDLVKLLLTYGADANAIDNEGNTPLIYGALGDHPHVCNELLSKGADVTIANENDVDAYKATIKKDAYTAKAVIENFLVQKILQELPTDII